MKILRTTVCPKCKSEVRTKPGFISMCVDRKFYGGKSVKFMDAVCGCGEEYIAVMKPDGNNYKLFDLAVNEPEQVDITKMERKELIALAKQIGVEGKIATMKTTDLITAIQEKQKS